MIKIHKITAALLLASGFLAVQHVHAMLYQPGSPFQQTQQPPSIELQRKLGQQIVGEAITEKQLKTGMLTIKNLSKRPKRSVTVRAYYRRADTPFTDIKIKAGETIEIPYYESGNLTGIGVPWQTVSIGTWEAVEKIIDAKDPESFFKIDYKEGKWRKVN